MTEVRTEGGVIVGNVYDKFAARNLIARALVRGFMASFDALVAATDAQDVHEVGCGEGNLTARLRARGLIVRGSDFSEAIIAEARHRHGAAGIRFDVKSIYELAPDVDAASLGRLLVGHFDEILAFEWGRKGIAVTLTGTAVYTLSLIALAASWTVIALTAVPDGRQLAIAIRIYARSGIAKYLPGNIFHLVGRQLLGRALGVSQTRLAVATVAEIALSMLSVWIIATAVFAALPGPISRAASFLALIFGLLAAIAFVAPNLLHWIVPRIAPVLHRVVGNTRDPEFAVALTLNLAFFLCLALLAGSGFRALTGEALPPMQVGAMYLGAWVAGYIILGASGGLDVREAVLLVLLDGVAGEPAVLAFALVMRVQNTAGDLLFFVASYALPLPPPAHAETSQSARSEP